MEIRLINGKSQTDSAVRLMRETFMHSVAPLYAPRGVDNFLAFIEDRTLVQSLELFGAFENAARVGVLGVKEGRRHICCFFVQASYQRQGIGRRLWEHLLTVRDNEMYTVHASPNAVPAYIRLGFAAAAEEQNADCMRFTPMRFIREENV